MLEYKVKSEKGIGLIETIMALGLAVVVLTGIVTLTINTLRSATHSRLMLSATTYASEELERLRALRDNNTWQDFISLLTPCNPLGTPIECMIKSDLSVYVDEREILGLGGEVMERYFIVTDVAGGALDPSDTVLRFSVTVTWFEGAHQRSVHTYTDLSNWRNN
jgi:hypothetical protein